MTDPLSAERVERLQTLLARAAARPTAEREEFLREECAGDDDLFAEVLSLLRSLDDAGDGFLERHSPGGALRGRVDAAGPLPTDPPRRLGPLHLERHLAQGGMSTVWLGTMDGHDGPVAIKLVRAEPDTMRGRRFSREAALMGRLEHPCIARCLGAGTEDMEDGPPLHWLAVEYVDGPTLTDHVRGRSLSVDERLELLLDVCDAVAHAHDRGVIHRDLKPDNILVAPDGRPRVLDFGVARDLEEMAATLHTRTGDVLGTLAYMSPEQAAGRPTDVDERTDVYALGVLAYELVAGRLPHDLDRFSVPEALGVIHGMDADRLREADPGVSRDLEAIVAQALEKDPRRRYPDVRALAADIRRHLAHEDIRARSPGAVYRLARFARRNRAVVTALVGVFASLALGAVVALDFALQEADARRDAEAEATAARSAEYRASMAAALRALESDDVVAAAGHVQGAPRAQRGWEWRHARARLDGALGTFRAVDGVGQSMVWTGDDRLVSLAREVVIETRRADGRVRRLRAARDGETFHGMDPDGRWAWSVWNDRWQVHDLHSDTIRDLTGPDVAPDAEPRGTYHGGHLWLVVRTDDGRSGTVRVDPTDGRVVEMLDMPFGWTSTPFSADGSYMIGSDVTVRPAATTVWDVRHNRPGGATFGRALFGAVFLGPGGPIVAHAGGGRTGAWTRDGTALPWADRGGGSRVHSIVPSPDGTHLAVLHDNGTVRLLDAADGRNIAHWDGPGWAGYTALPAFLEGGRMLAFADEAESIRVVHTSDGSTAAVLTGHQARIQGLAAARGGGRLASSDVSGVGRLWDPLGPETTTVLRGHESYVYDVAVSPDGRRIASAAWDGTVRLWDAGTGAAVGVLESPAVWPYYGHVAWSPDGTRLAAVHGLTVGLWHADTGRLLDTARLDDRPDEVLAEDPPSYQEPQAIEWHPDGGRFLVAGNNRALVMFQADDDRLRRQVADLRAHTAAWTPDGERLVTWGPDGGAVARATDFQVVVRLAPVRDAVRSIAVSPDGTRALTSSDAGTARVWDLADGSLLHWWGRPGRAIYAVAWHPDGDRVASGGQDGSITVHDPDTGTELAVLRGHGAYVHGLDFSPDGDMLVSGSGDGEVRVWPTTGLGERSAERLRRREALARLRPEVDALVDELGPEGAADRLRARGDLSPLERRAALDLVLAPR